jgi:hypothetical protein
MLIDVPVLIHISALVAQEETIPDEEDAPRPQPAPKPKPGAAAQAQAASNPAASNPAAANPPPVVVAAPQAAATPYSGYDLNLDQAARERELAYSTLEGGFDVRLESGAGLYHLELRYDRGSQHVSGAWRGFVIAPGLSHSGLIDRLEATPTSADFGFVDGQSKALISLKVTRLPDGKWTGTLQSGTEPARPVTMNRVF